MGIAKNILNQINNSIERCTGNSAKISIEFTDSKMEFPVRNIHIATGIRNADVHHEVDEYGNKNTVKTLTIEATICAPKVSSGDSIVDVVDAIITASLLDTFPPLVKLYTGKASYSSTLGAIIQSVYITVKTD